MWHFVTNSSSSRISRRLYFDIENSLTHFKGSGKKDPLVAWSCLTHACDCCLINLFFFNHIYFISTQLFPDLFKLKRPEIMRLHHKSKILTLICNRGLLQRLAMILGGKRFQREAIWSIDWFLQELCSFWFQTCNDQVVWRHDQISCGGEVYFRFTSVHELKNLPQCNTLYLFQLYGVVIADNWPVNRGQGAEVRSKSCPSARGVTSHRLFDSLSSLICEASPPWNSGQSVRFLHSSLFASLRRALAVFATCVDLCKRNAKRQLRSTLFSLNFASTKFRDFEKIAKFNTREK